MDTETLTGIERLRRVVRICNLQSETFNERFTAEQLLALHDAYTRCGWDIVPEAWSDEQVTAALAGTPPTFDEDSAYDANHASDNVAFALAHGKQ